MQRNMFRVARVEDRGQHHGGTGSAASSGSGEGAARDMGVIKQAEETAADRVFAVGDSGQI
jgi:hypothetical protein